MNRNRLIMSIILALVGVIWALQGLGIIAGRSFMVGSTFWAVAGIALIAGSVLYAIWPTIRRR